MATSTVLVACGGAQETDLFRGDGGTLLPGDRDGGISAPDAAAPAPDAGSASAPGVACQALTCALGREVCCRRATAATSSLACAAPADCAGAGEDAPLAVTCDDADDCAAMGRPATVCCGDYVVDAQRRPRVRSVACIAPRECLEPQGRVVLCGDGRDAQCPPGTRCEVSQVAIPGFRMCVRTSG